MSKKINKIIEENQDKIFDFLKKRKLEIQYLKNIRNLLDGNCGKCDFKLRKPKEKGIYSFRINKQFRAFGYFRNNGIFAVTEINNHQ